MAKPPFHDNSLPVPESRSEITRQMSRRTPSLASSLEPEDTASAAYPPSSFQPVSGPPSLRKSSSHLQGNEGVVERGLKRAAKGQTSDKEDKLTTASQDPESHKGDYVTDSYGAVLRKLEPNRPSSGAPDPERDPKTTPQSTIERMYSSSPSHRHYTGSTRPSGPSMSPTPPGSIRPLKSTPSLRQQEGRGVLRSPSEQNRAGPMMTEIPSSPGISFNPKHSAPLPPPAQASPGPIIAREGALSGPVPGAGTPSEVRDKPTRPSGTTYSIFSSSPLGLLEYTFSINSIHTHSTQITTFS
jgi:hypothetical protein